MKWFHPKHGDTRIVKKFLWWPCRIKNETRWLEHAVIEQEYTYFNDPLQSVGLTWKNIIFLS